MSSTPPSEPNRARYNAGLRDIESDIIRMGSIVLEMIVLATRVALEDEPALSEEVLKREDEVDAMEQRIFERIVVTLGLENPLARDLQMLSASLSMVGELEKVGDEATKLAMRLVKLRGEFPYQLREMLQEMSRQAQTNLIEGLRLFNRYSAEGAEKVAKQEEEVDKTYKTSRNLILAMLQEHPENARQYLRCVEVFHALEHVSDHAADIAKRMRACYERFATVAQ